MTNTHPSSKVASSKTYRPNCPILEEKGIDYESKEGIEICLNCPRYKVGLKCVFDEGLKSINKQKHRERDKEIRDLNQLKNISVEQLSNMFGISKRSIERVLSYK